MRLLIVDDEALIREGMREDLGSIPQMEVVDECGTVAEAVRILQGTQIDLVLLDVQLPDGTGFDVVRAVGPSAMPAVIFVTAFDQYAIQAFECSAVDYLLKPFDDLRLQTSIEKARSRLLQPGALIHQLETLLKARENTWSKRLVVRNEERTDLVPVESIDWIEAANNYSVLHCGSRTYVLSETLSTLEQKLNPAEFLRIQRGRIVNVSRVVALSTIAGGIYELELRNGTRLSSGRQYREGVQGLLKG